MENEREKEERLAPIVEHITGSVIEDAFKGLDGNNYFTVHALEKADRNYTRYNRTKKSPYDRFYETLNALSVA